MGRENGYEQARGHPAPCYLKNINMKKIIVLDFPATFTFKVKQPLPDFKYGCPVRTKILWSELKKQNINSEFHDYDGYTIHVARVSEYMPDHEFWFIGN